MFNGSISVSVLCSLKAPPELCKGFPSRIQNIRWLFQLTRQLFHNKQENKCFPIKVYFCAWFLELAIVSGRISWPSNTAFAGCVWLHWQKTNSDIWFWNAFIAMLLGSLLCPPPSLGKFGERKEMVWLAAKVMSKVVLTSILKWAVQCSPKCCRRDSFSTIDAPFVVILSFFKKMFESW